MPDSTIAETLRRSSRVPAKIKVLVSSLEPDVQFTDICETLIVSAHGCAMRAPQPLRIGVTVHLRLNDGSETIARIVNCTRLNPEQQGWVLGAKLDKPGNFWGLNPCPTDWLEPSPIRSDATKPQPPSAAASGPPIRQTSPPVAPAVANPEVEKTERKMSTWPLTSPPQRKPSTDLTDALRQLSARADELEGQSKQAREAIAQFGDQLAHSLKELDRVRSETLEVRPVSQTQDRESFAAAFGELIQPLKEEIGELRRELEKQTRVEPQPAISPADLIPELQAELCTPLRKEVETALASHANMLQAQIAGMQQQLGHFFAMRNEMATSAQSFAETLERRQAAVPAMIVHETAPLREQMVELASRIGSVELAGSKMADQVAGTMATSVQSFSETVERTQTALPVMIVHEMAPLREQMAELASRIGSLELAGAKMADLAGSTEVIRDQVAKQQHESVAAMHEQLQAITQKQEEYLAGVREQLLAMATQKQDEFLASAKQQLLMLVEEKHEKQDTDVAALREQLVAMLREKSDESLAVAREQATALVAEKQAGYLVKIGAEIAAVTENQVQQIASVRDELRDFVSRELDPLKTSQSNLQSAMERLAQSQIEWSPSPAQVSQIIEPVRASVDEQLARIHDRALQAEAVLEEVTKARESLSASVQSGLAGLEQRVSVILDQVTSQHGLREEQLSAIVREQAKLSCDDLLSNARERWEQVSSLAQARLTQLEQVASIALDKKMSTMQDELAQLIARGTAELQDQWRKVKNEADISTTELVEQRGRELLVILEAASKQIEGRLGEQADAQLREIQQLREGQITPLVSEAASAANQLRSMASSLDSETKRAEAQLGTMRKHRFDLEQWFANQVSVSKAEVNAVLAAETTAAVLRAGEQIENAVRELLSDAQEQNKSELSAEWKALQARAKSLETEVTRTLGVLQSENRRSQAQIETVHQEREDLAAWLRQRSEDFHKEVSDALMQSDSQIKNQFQTAAEIFERPVQELCQRALQQLEQHTKQKTKELQQQVDDARESLTQTQGAIEASVEALLTERVAQTIASFNQSVEEVKQQISEELRTALATDLILIANGFVKQPRTDSPAPSK